MWLDAGPIVTPELIHRFEDEFSLLIPQPLVDFWFQYGNGGYPEGQVIVTVIGPNGRPLTSDIDIVYGIYHEKNYCDLGTHLHYIPRHFPLFPFAVDQSDGTFGISLCPQTFGQVYHYIMDEERMRRTEELSYVASSPIEVMEKFAK